MEKGGKKRLAVLVGCNYPNTPIELHGCINDVLAMRDVLTRRFGFDHSQVELLIDAPPGGSTSVMPMPTGANIKNALSRMVDQAEPGDVLFFHYSGHGTRIPSLKPGHPFKQLDEAIVPCDFNLITDVDFRELVNRLPKGASFTILSDSCHSGGLIDKEKEQIGPSSSSSSSSSSSVKTSKGTILLDLHNKPKTIPFESILQQLSSLTRINTSDTGTHLLELFGADASLRFRLPQLELLLDLFGPLKKPDDGILLSGCQANETSADIMSPAENSGGGDGKNNKAYGAFSNSVQTVLNENKGRRPPLSNREIVMLARKVLEEQRVEQQHPCLYCSDENAAETFLLQPAE